MLRWEPTTFIFRDYNYNRLQPIFWGVKPSFFMGTWGSNGYMDIRSWSSFLGGWKPTPTPLQKGSKGWTKTNSNLPNSSRQAKEQVEKEREKARLKRAERADATKEKEKQKKDFRELKREEDLLSYLIGGVFWCQDVRWTSICFGGISTSNGARTFLKHNPWRLTRCDVWLMAFLKVWTPKCWANCKKGQRRYQTSEQISPEKARVWVWYHNSTENHRSFAISVVGWRLTGDLSYQHYHGEKNRQAPFCHKTCFFFGFVSLLTWQQHARWAPYQL